MPRRPSISREEVLEGLLGGRKRRAQSVLNLIQAKTAQLVLQNRQAMVPHFGQEAWSGQNIDYLRAVASAGDALSKPTIQQLERFAPRWESLVPDSPEIRAATAQKLAEAYTLRRAALPQLRTALGLDTSEVAQAFQDLAGEPLEAIYRSDESFTESLKWTWSKLSAALENLPPFWTALALMITGTIGPSILALPIAFAGIGPLPGVGVLLLVGIINTLTVAYMAESCARNSAIAHGSSFIGRVIRDFLGNLPAQVMRVSLFIFCCFALFAFYNGFGAALGNISGIPDGVWIALLFTASCYYLTRKTLTMTVATALIIGLINVAIILLLSLFAFHVAGWATYAERLPVFSLDSLFKASVMQLVFGVTFYAFCGHVSVSNCAQVVLRRDPTGRSLLWGCTTGVAVVMLIYCLWVLAVNGSIDGGVLAGERGTALAPLADRAGPLVHVFGALFVVLGLGIGSILYALGIVNMGREVVGEHRRKASGSGTSGVVDVDDQAFSVLFNQILTLPAAERSVMTQLMRAETSGESEADAILAAGLDEAETQVALTSLVERGLLQPATDGKRPRYRVKALLRAPTAGRVPSLVKAAGTAGGGPEDSSAETRSAADRKPADWVWGTVPLIPVIAIFAASEVLYLLGLQSFAEPLAWVGGLLPPLIAGVFPALLLIASRNKGRAVQSSLATFLTSWPVIFSILLASLASYLVHAFVIWPDPLPRALSLAMALGVLVLIAYLLRRNVFAPALLLEVLADESDGNATHYRIVLRGKPLTMAHKLTYPDYVEERRSSNGEIADFDRLLSLEMDLDPNLAKHLRISVQKASPDGELAAYPCWLSLLDPDGQRRLQLDKKGGSVSISIRRDQHVARLLLQPTAAPQPMTA